ncbi:MAG: bifunctional alpha/beta hydrolase/OsmC family protein [Pseudomonadota bacterium]
MELKSGRVDFPGSSGERLAARLDVPEGEIVGWALFAHCFSCSKDILAAQRIARRLSSRGIAVLRFDFTGLGHSEGDFANTNFSSNVADLVAAADWLGNAASGPDMLIGHSLGGAAVIVAAKHIASVRAVVTIGAPADAEHVIDNFGEKISEIESRGEATVSLAGRPFTIQRQFLEDVRGAAVRSAAAALGKPLLVMHAPLDGTVGIDNATGLFVAAKHPKSFISLDDADHLMSGDRDAVFAADALAGWAGRYLAAPEGAVGAASDQALGTKVRVTETRKSAYQVSVAIGGRSFFADEPVALGGAGTGPDPYQWVSAGLGACTAITLRMYANRKGWPLRRVSVEVDHDKDHAEDCAECDAGRKVDIFERNIEFDGDLEPSQRARLLEIADMCPVHKTLTERGHVRTQLSSPGDGRAGGD